MAKNGKISFDDFFDWYKQQNELRCAHAEVFFPVINTSRSPSPQGNENENTEVGFLLINSWHISQWCYQEESEGASLSFPPDLYGRFMYIVLFPM
eukprot:749948-Hanusia_phi.AAC.2